MRGGGHVKSYPHAKEGGKTFSHAGGGATTFEVVFTQ